jgi:Glycosyl transferase family 11
MAIYLRLAGGFGNQLYQMAALALLVSRTGLVGQVVLDGLNDYAAAREPDVEKVISNEWVSKFVRHDQLRVMRWLVNNGRIGRWLPFVGVSDRNYWPIVFGAQLHGVSPVVLDGYFQSGWSYSLLSEAIDSLKIDYSIFSGCDAVFGDECAIHVRGGDFRLIAHHQVVGVDYYVSACRLASIAGWRKFVIVTDDADYGSEVLNILKATCSELSFRQMAPAKNFIEDFSILMNSPARIIGNSTFSWWATALDRRRSQTWAPVKFSKDRNRDFFLPWETSLD